ncbi:hypothetical protein HBH92_152780 [Parastagonospora nodorum]|nr:hypothetical protein HBH92_152780 [Parastagonospora nodorum]KAH4442248.1 hypothetical protein HBH93_076790 [Parastagonospora nodorum]KAH4453654.1 hypothetical protein HBH91_105020 [Parastagonospora nodorum]KAH4510515.1 hypothetical protein HBH89_055330 [Parastagonospora nodorum]KAH4546493.1 hypothetical protein HBH86_138720 [Parastagonospora nodorum]
MLDFEPFISKQTGASNEKPICRKETEIMTEDTQASTEEAELRILKALANQRAGISKLQNKLKMSRRRPTCAEAKVDEAEQRALQTQFELVEFEEEACEAAEAIEQLSRDLQTARDGEAQANDKAEEAKEQLEEIWKAVQDSGVALLGKRKAAEGPEGHTAKKVRVEPEA